MGWEKLRNKAIEVINDKGVLLVYPIKNKKLPESLWSSLFPRTPMQWDWSDAADSKVSQIWILREDLSRSKEVVYAKWYQGRATFFSKELFPYFLAATREIDQRNDSMEAQEILEILQVDSPLSTKQLKRLTGLQGRLLEPHYNRATKALWQRLLLVGLGELDEGAFPSLLMGATQLVFEELYLKSQSISPSEAQSFLLDRLGEHNEFFKYLKRLTATKGNS